MEYEKLIRENLTAINEDFDGLKPAMQKRIVEIETIIQNRCLQQENAINTLKTTDFTLKSIAEEIGASRTTLYNHEQLLKRYIEQSISTANDSNPITIIDKVQKEKSLLQSQIDKMMHRDLDMELLKLQNRELASTLEGKNAEITRLQYRISELSNEIRTLKSEGATTNRKRAKVFPINK